MAAVGEKFPETELTFITEDQPALKSSAEAFGGKKVVLFAVPGAFTPTCHANHLPGFLTHLDAIKAKGVDMIACLAVNDPFVMKVWAKDTGALGKIEMIADGAAIATKQLGLEMDASAFGLGIRSRRYAMVIDDMTITALMIEDGPGKADISGAESVLAAL
ncbi:MAG: peroxiredoxin [Pseudomonadota bacterium]